MSSWSCCGESWSLIHTWRTKPYSLPMAFKQLADISSTLSSLWRKRRTKGESNGFALTGPEILWLKWPRGSRQIWQSVSFWVELLVNHSFLLNCRNAFSLNWAICSRCSLSPAAGMHVGREAAIHCLPAPSVEVGVSPQGLFLICSSHLRPHCWDCFTRKDKKTAETWSYTLWR